MRNIRWLDSAELELACIIQYVRRTFGRETALRVFNNIVLRVEMLENYPYMGTLEACFKYQGLDIYVLHEWHTKIFYSVTDNEIIIVLVWNNKKDDNLIKFSLESAE